MNDFFTNLFYFVLIGVAIFFIIKFINRYKFPKIGAVTVFVGGVKSGKSAVSVSCAIRQLKKAQRTWRFRQFIIRVLNVFKRKKFEYEEKPLLYSNIPLAGIDYVPITREHLLRKVRFNFKSIVFLDEMSLIADSMLIKDKEINTQLLLFFKLFGHETHGGKCIVNSHCISDLHYALKRTTSQYFYMHHLSSYIPFIKIAYMREERYSEDGTATNVYNEDLEHSLCKVLMFNNIFKKYDSFCFSSLTDNLPIKNPIKHLSKKDSLKATSLPSFRPEFYNLNFQTGEIEIIKREIDENAKKDD